MFYSVGEDYKELFRGGVDENIVGGGVYKSKSTHKVTEKSRMYFCNGEFTVSMPVASSNPIWRACALQIEGERKGKEKEEGHDFVGHQST